MSGRTAALGGDTARMAQTRGDGVAESDKPRRCLVRTPINFAPLAGCFWAGEEKVRKINTGNSLHQTRTIASKARSSLGYGPNISGIEDGRPSGSVQWARVSVRVSDERRAKGAVPLGR